MNKKRYYFGDLLYLCIVKFIFMKEKILMCLKCVYFYITLLWYKIVNNNKAVLLKLKREVESLPNGIWTEEDYKKVRVDDSVLKEINKQEYESKRLHLKKKVMHLENKIGAYVRKEFGETSDLLKEFNNYSFFPNDFIVNSFNIVENEYWHRGKCLFLYFIDKLIDEKQVRDELASTGFKGFLRLLLYLLIMVFIYAYLFEYDEYPDILVPYLNDIYKRILLFIMAVFLCFIIVRYDEKKFLLGSFLTVLLLYLSVYFAN